MTTVYFGPGTITFGSIPVSFEAEVMGGAVTHEYKETTPARTMLSGLEIKTAEKRTDGLAFTCENDLTAAGMYAYLETNDLTEVTFVYTPNTANGAKWAGTVVAKLPPEIGADEFGAPIASEVALPGVGTFTFTPGT